MNHYPRKLLFLLVFIVSSGASQGQSIVSTLPVPGVLKQAVSFDVGANTPFIGISYHRQLLRLTKPQSVYLASLDLAVGVGYIPTICIFGCNRGSLSTHHVLLVRWGRRFQAELGYAGVLAAKEALSEQAYLPGALIGLRYSSPAWLFRLNLAGLFYHQDKTELRYTGELIIQRDHRLFLSPGLSIGKRF